MRRLVAALLLGLFVLPLARAETLRLGVALETDSIDPHFHWYGPLIEVTRQVFEPLVVIDGNGAVAPLLAKSWHAVGQDGWAFELRDATFSDGTPLTPDDVVFTLGRAGNVPNSPTGFGVYLRSVASVEVTGPHGILVHTTGTAPMLPRQLSTIAIVSRKHGEGATTADYNALTAAVGTGPYRFTAWDRGAGVGLARNDRYWGAGPAWDSVRIQAIPNPSARVGALLAGDVDLIDQLPAPDVPRLSANPAFRVTRAVSFAVVSFLPDVTERVPPYITANDGSPLPRNPLADLRVRQAVALAINRTGLVERVLSGEAVAASQLMQPGQFGYDPSVPDAQPDPARAKALLAEAGYPDGFRMTVHCQQRFYNADAVCQAVAQMLTRIGIRAEPDAMPQSMYVTRSMKHEFSFGTTYPMIDLGDPAGPLIGNAATWGGPNGWGNSNRGRYSNAALDALFGRIETEMDPARREGMLREANRVVLSDVAAIPVFRPMNIEAMRAGLRHQPIADGYVFAADVRPSPESRPIAMKP